MERRLLKWTLLLGLIPLFSTAQDHYFYRFEQMEITDTLTVIEADSLKRGSEFIYPEYFLVGRNFKNEPDTTVQCLIRKINDHWISYAIPNEFGNTQLLGLSQNPKYFLASSSFNHLSHGGGHGNENGIENLIIIDLSNHSWVQLESYSLDQYWEQNENGELTTNEKSESISKFSIDENQLTELTTCYSNGQFQDCFYPGSVYEFRNGELQKIKRYDTKKMGFSQIHYAGRMAFGMALADVLEAYPDVEFTKTANRFGMCADDKKGFAISIATDTLAFVLTRPIKEGETDTEDGGINLSNEKIFRIFVESEGFQFGKLSKKSTASEILKLYPTANVRLDLLTNWEHIYIQELSVEFVFKTNDKNRIGKYRDETFVKLRNKRAKPDFIAVSD
ncbi:hypothetical protein [Flavobacterium silvaticum]|uniref:Uncharacterized protein n=1 Tax=Flavobacterium silvaticum TaxID=1852020 RepID=A0A972FIY5_9FLAO|nr:hypothetical protein [Flavobacterium silvaticum]NMH26821.1 hypothetical protein [Flavobacterium silvaticum]